MVSCKGLMLWISSHVMFSIVYLGLYGCSCYVMLIFDDNMFDIVLCLVYSLSYFFLFFFHMLWICLWSSIMVTRMGISFVMLICYDHNC